ncbi:pyridoxal-phosphate dependent enzyme [Cellulophaga sp. 20_2_10]|uniref:1-aminocyclopropane-1-carboxylate deaminase/D-cysteine desulfhydrase n=1 Tax=Cellulophaga sp. 20_2_10 TaxID=2942476 RepID=UPI00201AC7C4|nr:pyridoxal-phosphate dependent enzyme [Cellulophaga sp. 20_2_10]
MKVLNQQVQLPILSEKKISLYIKREDTLHPFISGNKFRKLKYNLLQAQKLNAKSILTFGGAFSNHIAATAYAGKENGIKTIGVIRGEELASKWQHNPTLSFAKDNGMEFKFISREAYREKNSPDFLASLETEFPNSFMLPEGGANDLAVKGCEEILTTDDRMFNIICSAVGTGGTIAGIINSTSKNQRVLGFPALKGDFLKEDICKFAQNTNWELLKDYHFGGYAKVSQELIAFINYFKRETNISLDPVYTGKMLFGILDLVHKDYFAPGTKIVAIHTGGLQGIKGMNSLLKKKKLPLINE